MLQTIYSGRVAANAGFSSPEPFDGPHSWTVSKLGQTEIYRITHNLQLLEAHKQLHVVATSETVGICLSITHDTNFFTVTARRAHDQAAAPADFSFIAIHYAKI